MVLENTLSIAELTALALSSPWHKAKTDGPDPEILQPKAPASNEASFKLSNSGIKTLRCFSTM